MCVLIITYVLDTPEEVLNLSKSWTHCNTRMVCTQPDAIGIFIISQACLVNILNLCVTIPKECSFKDIIVFRRRVDPGSFQSICVLTPYSTVTAGLSCNSMFY